MRIIDNNNLPLPLRVACQTISRKAGATTEISVRELVGPPRIRQLVRRLGESLEVEAAEGLVNAVFESGFRSLLWSAREGLDPTRYLIAQTFAAQLGGWTISSELRAIDLQEKIILDLRTASIELTRTGTHDDWVSELNVYRWLCHMNGIDIGRLELFAMFYDLSSDSSTHHRDVPTLGFRLIPVELWALSETARYVGQRLRLHQEAECVADRDLSICTKQEQWSIGHGFAVKNSTTKTDLGIFPTQREALHWLSSPKNLAALDLREIAIERREGIPRRCKSHCPVRFDCSYGRNWATG